MRIGKVHHEKCPICEYELHECQCIFGGNAHPDKSTRIRIVKDHLEMLSPKQVGHLITLEEWWNTSYGDKKYSDEYEKFKKFIEEQDLPLPEPWKGGAEMRQDDPSHPFADNVMMGD